MGLSAAQARLLTITSRKSDCEFQSMRYSHEKIALSRDLTNVSNEYQDALDTTKLVFDYYGTGSDGDPLSYSTLMTPSELNSYMPMITTTEAGRVVLDSRYAAAARAAGIPAEGLSGLPSSMIRDKFYNGLLGQGLISEDVADECKAVEYSQEIGVGASDIYSTVSTETMDISSLLDFISSSNDEIDFSDIYDNDYRDNNGYADDTDIEHTGYCLGSDGKAITAGVDINASKKVSLADLYNNNYVLYTAVDNSDGADASISGLYNLNVLKNAQCWDQIMDQLESALGVDSISKNACEEARKYIETVLDGGTETTYEEGYDPSSVKNVDAVNGLGSYYESYEDSATTSRTQDDTMVNIAINNANSCVGYSLSRQVHDYQSYYDHNLYAGGVQTEKSGQYLGDGLAINIKNIIAAYLTKFCYELNKVTGEEDTDNYTLDETGVTNAKSDRNFWMEAWWCDTHIYDQDTTKKGSVARQTTNLENIKTTDFKVVTSTDAGLNSGATRMSGAYDALFNQICLRGWTENEQINDNDYLQEMYKSGKYFLTTCNDDGYYYQGTYTTCSLIQEITDEEAIAKAEAKYNTEKQKINYKEEIIDLKMKNLDTEISSLTTEYDTVKSLISKNIEKGFKRYDA